jgi:hypothetical protein
MKIAVLATLAVSASAFSFSAKESAKVRLEWRLE